MILPVSAQWLFCRNRVVRVVGMWRAYRLMVSATDWLQETPLGGTGYADLPIQDWFRGVSRTCFFRVSKLEKHIARWDLAPPKFASRWCPKCTSVGAAPWSTTLQNCLKTWIPYIRLRSQRGTRATKKTSKSIVLAQDLVKKFASKKKTQKQQKNMIFQKAAKSATQKK